MEENNGFDFPLLNWFNANVRWKIRVSMPAFPKYAESMEWTFFIIPLVDYSSIKSYHTV